MATSPARHTPAIPADRTTALSMLAADLRRIFANDFHALVAYGLGRDQRDQDEPVHTLAIVEQVSFEHLAACAPVTETWRRGGLAIPLIISRDEFARTLDIFPLEYHGIISSHVVVEGPDPFDGLGVPEADLRRACEGLAKSHLIHLREGFLEGSREPRAIARLIASSAPAFRAILINISQLDGTGAPASDDEIAADAEATIGVPASVVRDVLGFERHATAATDPTALLQRYISAAERVWRYVDGWKG